jgi:small GTP-binding protein
MEYYNIETSIKIVIIGDSGVGKTNLLHRYTQKTFLDNTKSTLGVDFVSFEKIVDKSKVKIQFWDTAGQENFMAIAKTYYKQVTLSVILNSILSLS